MRILLELLRIILIFLISGSFYSMGLSIVYKSIGVSRFEWIGALAVLVVLFVIYRNRWQFKGWYKGEEKVMLSQKTTKLLLFFRSAPTDSATASPLFQPINPDRSRSRYINDHSKGGSDELLFSMISSPLYVLSGLKKRK